VAEDGLSSSALSAAIGLSGKQSLVDTLNWLLDQGLVSRAGKARATRYTITEAGRIRLTEVGR
jgi:DNA-binding PadR family transcriptional regulator